jgi:hypothetical protein
VIDPNSAGVSGEVTFAVPAAMGGQRAAHAPVQALVPLPGTSSAKK